MSDDEVNSKEQWRPIPDFEGRYEVSDHGRVRSLPRFVRRGNNGYMQPGVMLKLSVGKRGYPMASIGRAERRPVHLYVLRAFVGPRPPGMETCHADDNKTNNRLSNLRWDTPKANRSDARRNGVLAIGSKNGHAKLSEDEVREIMRRFTAGERPTALAVEYGIAIQTMSSIRHRWNWKQLNLPPLPDGRKKLCENDVRRIHQMIASGMSSSSVANVFGVHKSTIKGVRSGRNWKHVCGA